jgi:hypothetical protein
LQIKKIWDDGGILDGKRVRDREIDEDGLGDGDREAEVQVQVLYMGRLVEI